MESQTRKGRSQNLQKRHRRRQRSWIKSLPLGWTGKEDERRAFTCLLHWRLLTITTGDWGAPPILYWNICVKYDGSQKSTLKNFNHMMVILKNTFQDSVSSYMMIIIKSTFQESVSSVGWWPRGSGTLPLHQLWQVRRNSYWGHYGEAPPKIPCL